MEISERIADFAAMLSCKYTAYYWHADREMGLLNTNCPSAAWWMGFFGHFGYKTAVREHFESNPKPLLIGDSLGIMWSIVREPQSEHYYVLGPVLNTECSAAEMWEFFRTARMKEFGKTQGLTPGQTQQRMMEEIRALPLVPLLEFGGDTTMLHCCVTGTPIHRSDLTWRRERLKTASASAPKTKDRQRTYNFSQALMRAVEQGDLSYQTLLDQAPLVSSGVPIRTKDPLLQAKLSVFTFTSRCTDAAIRGGLTPDQAYSLGDGYTQQIMDATTLSDLPAISHTMYADFIHAVHKHNRDPKCSRQIDQCIHYIADHIEGKIDLADLAGHVGYADYYLSRKFKEETGISLKDYIKSAKTEHAKLLLLATDATVAQIAERLGYGSVSYFVRQFREAVGMTPSQWRDDNNLP